MAKCLQPHGRRSRFGLLTQLASEFQLERPASDVKELIGRALVLGHSGHFAKAFIREILSLPFADRLQNETGSEFGCVAIGIAG